MTRVLVTGATGFIGRALVAALERTQHVVIAASRSHTDTVLDLTSTASVAAALDSAHPDVVVNLAAAATSREETEFSSVANVNTVGALRLFEQSQRIGVRRFIQVGTAMVYGFRADPVDEGTPLAPRGAYAVSKACAWQMLQAAQTAAGTQLMEARLFNVFGEGNQLPRLDAALYHGAASGQEVRLSAGDQRRDFLHVEELAMCLRGLVDAPDAKFPHGKSINIARGEPTRVRDFAESLGRALGISHLLRFGEATQRQDDLYSRGVTWQELASGLGLPRLSTLEQRIAQVRPPQRNQRPLS
ncbi:MAG: NAD-dependent epimerase/dehydratase family protein [Polyangiaceae bacterium]